MTERRFSAKDIKRLEELESRIARALHERDSARRAQRALYERNRRLENKIRDTIVVGENFNASGLYQLRQMVPNKPRRTWRQLVTGRK